MKATIQNKELCLTTDIIDDFLFAGILLQENHLEDMMRYAASLGCSRFEWVLGQFSNMHAADGPFGYDLLKVACESAHRHGMRFDVSYKPFETGMSHAVMRLPQSFPQTDEDRIIVNENGILYAAYPFLAAHPEFRSARRQGDGADPGGALKTIRLIKFDEDDIAFDPESIEFRYSEANGNFTTYSGKLDVEVHKEWRLFYPYHDRLSTVLSFTGFDLPESVRYLEVRCKQLSSKGSFSNHIESMVELVNDRGEVIPSAPSTAQLDFGAMYKRAKAMSDLGLSDYLNKPEVKDLLKDPSTFEHHVDEHCRGMYFFQPQWEVFTLDREGSGVIAVHRGKPQCHPTELHPIYSEVRQSWLDDIQFCIDRGVDGVNIRISRHGGMNEPWAYGFNQPVLDKMKDPDNDHEAALVSGAAFDTFMEDAAQLLHKNGKEIGVHLCGFLLRPADKLMATTKPSNIAWNWEHWVNDIVDYTEFHKTNFYKFHNVKQILDHFGTVVSRAGKPFIYQSGQSSTVTHYDPPHRFLPFEMEWVRDHPHLTCYNLYETASFFKMTADGTYQGSPHIRERIEKHWKQHPS